MLQGEKTKSHIRVGTFEQHLISMETLKDRKA